MENQKQKSVIRFAIMLVLVSVINYLGSFIASTLGLPLFLDSLGTVLGVVFGGFWIGASGGFIYNIISASISGNGAASVWGLSSIFIAFIVWLLLRYKKVKLDSCTSLFSAGIIVAILNSILTTIISFVFFKSSETFLPSVLLQKSLAFLSARELLNISVAHLVIEIIDKSLIFLIVFGIYKFSRRRKPVDFKKLAISASILIAVLTFTSWINTRENIHRTERSNDILIKDQARQAISMLETVYEGHLDGMYSFEQAENMGADLLRNLRYGDDNEGYFWADTSDGTNIVLYGREDVEGKNRIDSYVGGIYHVREIIANGKKSDGGYTDYFYTKKGGEKPLAKRSYSLYFAPFDWIVGTGYYPEDLEK